MSKLRSTLICKLISLLLCLGFAVHTVIDYTRYSATLNSAPFSLWIAVNAVCFLLPASILFVVGILIKRVKKSHLG